ncbi:MAG: tyrosine-type recombinase/integrase [Saprospiraceae bacterium]|nr:tyrosine-type recombinase/integrase [Saprospiraceae bacterium]
MKPRNHKFYLKTSEHNSESSIQYRCNINGERFKFGTAQSIYPELWDPQTGRPTTDKKLIKEYKSQIPTIETRLSNTRTILDNLCQEVNSFISNAEINRIEIDFEAMRTHLTETALRSSRIKNSGKGTIKAKEAAKSGNNFQYIRQYTEHFIWAITNGSKTIQHGPGYKKRYSHSTIKNYKGFLTQWIEFEKNQNNRYKWEDISQGLYDDFTRFFRSKNYTQDTTGRMIKHFKVIIQAALIDKLHNTKVHREPYFKTLSSKIDNIALTQVELAKLEKLNLLDKPGFEKVRDIFLMGCYTALRFSDLKRLNPEYIQGDQIDIPTQKTKKRVIIPIGPKLKKLLTKYDFHAPKIEEQKVNQYIKIIAERAGITDSQHIVETRAGITNELHFKRFELITTHTARRTAATNMYLADLKPRFIMAITGHSTESSFFKYIILPKERVVQELSENEFFK